MTLERVTSAQERRRLDPTNHLIIFLPSSTCYFDFPPLGLCAYKYVRLPLIMFLPSRISSLYRRQLLSFIWAVVVAAVVVRYQGGAPLHHVAVRKEEEKKKKKTRRKVVTVKMMKKKDLRHCLAAIKRERNRQHARQRKNEEGNSSTTAESLTPLCGESEPDGREETSF